MKYYFQNGISSDQTIYKDKFVICESKIMEGEYRYSYQGSDLVYELENKCLILINSINKLLFPDIKLFELESYIIPLGILDLGLNSELNGNNDKLNNFINKIKKLSIYKKVDIFRYFYLYDLYNILDTLQELFINIDISFIGFFKMLCEVDTFFKDSDGIYESMGITQRYTYHMLNSFFITIHSAFDIITKLSYELEKLKYDENIYEKFREYRELKCNGIIFDRKGISNIKHIKRDNTIFDDRDLNIKIIESIRNDLVHNMVLSPKSSVYLNIKNKKIIEKFILMPDFDNCTGRFLRYKNRNKFFQQKINSMINCQKYIFLF
ncbi:hypothetical protein [Brachyspira hyodysenteriae]|uniref:hypothetical protein n=1 Tax=Brachyspira hyodysenteriae TaxID=159 RepID=UPI00063DBDB1|nr:hypothetical protein [Brachyspira hyodysenteriae]KLI33106.1 hypothetical protein SZ49_00050 [Brachyspira hyodysenteriae]